MKAIIFRAPDHFANSIRKAARELGFASVSRYVRKVLIDHMHKNGYTNPAPEFKLKRTLLPPRRKPKAK